MLLGARSHTTKPNLEFLRSHFGDRIISNFCTPKWPARSPDLSPLDYWFWNGAATFIRKRQPQSFEDIKQGLSDYIATVSEDEIRRSVQHFRKRIEACLAVNGAVFEYLMKKNGELAVEFESSDDDEEGEVTENGDAVVENIAEEETIVENLEEIEIAVENDEEITSSIEITEENDKDDSSDENSEDMDVTIAGNGAENFNEMMRMIESNAIENLVDEIIEERRRIKGDNDDDMDVDREIIRIDAQTKISQSLYFDSDSDDSEVTFKK